MLPLGHLQGTIILLEDDDQSAALICELLTASGFKVIWLVESSTALERILELEPLVAIIDLDIQGSSSEEIIAHIHRANLKRRPRIMALTAHTAEADGLGNSPGNSPGNSLENSLGGGMPRSDQPEYRADTYVQRPLNPERFVAQLHNLLVQVQAAMPSLERSAQSFQSS
ncbi:MAG: response regulator transcription factor [Synechococcales cyanobacterium RM1_1_8]|nr:response regulator transcription factor [Synechococcales cyanobacterium RM1_1_8]